MLMIEDNDMVSRSLQGQTLYAEIDRQLCARISDEQTVVAMVTVKSIATGLTN